MPDPAAPPLSSGELAPDSPLAPLPDLWVPWPEIEDAAAIPGEADSAVPPDQAERRYSIRVDGLDQVAGDGLRRQFDELSSLKREAEGDADANAAQIDRLAREDVELLQDLLRAARSAEHTSELQSLMRNSYAAFLLKKKTTYH